jgi:hypothetical protein
MNTESGPDQDALAIQLAPGNIPVSYFSSLLRVVQACLREVARSDDGTRRHFERQPQPMLVLAGVVSNSGLTVNFVFTDPLDNMHLRELSSHTFNAFLDRLSEFVRELPQPGLWGGSRLSPPHTPFKTDLTRRMDQMYRELRRSPRVTLRFGGRSMEIEGDRMEIS